MSSWSPEFEQELTPLLKDWLKHQGRTQADLRRSLRALSTRMPAILEVLEREFRLNGLSGLASKLCQVEREWQEEDGSTSSSAEPAPAVSRYLPAGHRCSVGEVLPAGQK